MATIVLSERLIEAKKKRRQARIWLAVGVLSLFAPVIPAFIMYHNIILGGILFALSLALIPKSALRFICLTMDADFEEEMDKLDVEHSRWMSTMRENRR